MSSAVEALEPTDGNWKTVRLKDVCQFKPPKSIPREALEEDSLVSFVPMGDLGELTKHFEPHSTRKFGEVVKGYTYFADGDVLCAKITPCFENGKLGIARRLENGVGFGSSEFVVMRSKGELLPEFLYYYLSRNEFREAGKAVMSGAVGHKRVPKKYFENLEIPLPPLDEQKRIVAVLDQAFAALDRARAHVLKNLGNSAALLESFVESELKQSGGQIATLQQLLDNGAITSHLDGNHGSDYPRKEEFISSGVPYIAANCIIDGQIDFTRAKYLSEARAGKLRKGLARDGDIIFAHNASVGPVAILRTRETKVILGTSVTYYRCDPNQIDPEFLLHEMRGAQFRRQYEAIMKQATRNQVPITAQRKLTHIIPNIDHQKRIAAACSKVANRARELSKYYDRQLHNVDQLRRTLLEKAFAGELK